MNRHDIIRRIVANAVGLPRARLLELLEVSHSLAEQERPVAPLEPTEALREVTGEAR